MSAIAESPPGARSAGELPFHADRSRAAAARLRPRAVCRVVDSVAAGPGVVDEGAFGSGCRRVDRAALPDRTRCLSRIVLRLSLGQRGCRTAGVPGLLHALPPLGAGP